MNVKDLIRYLHTLPENAEVIFGEYRLLVEKGTWQLKEVKESDIISQESE